jgi:large subunit ribosomal protein L7A
MCDKLKNLKKVCGIKQVKKALKSDIAIKEIFVAADADIRLTVPIIEHCKSVNIPVVQVNSMEDLGKLCGIDVGCSIAAVCE